MDNDVQTVIAEQEPIESVIQHPVTNGLTNPYIHLATSDNTRKAYRHDIRHYENWGGRLPAQPEMVGRYLETYAPKLNPRTLARRLIALRHWHHYQGFPDPTVHPAIQKTMVGIARTHGKPKDKARALSFDELVQISSWLTGQPALAAARDNALIQFGYFGALRRSELIAIHVEHIKWDKAGIEILLPASKTDQTHEGQYCVIPYGNELLCPLRALKHWLNQSTIQTGAIFRRITRANQLGDTALTPLSVNHIIKHRAQQAGIDDIDTLSSHSLRRGLATSAARAGATLQSIMRAGRWKQTNTVMEYIEASERFADNAATTVMERLNITTIPK